MTDREIMQQALSAFEAILFEKNIEATQIIARNARYSLREALAQPEQESKPMYVMGNYAGEGKVVSASFGLPKGAFEFAPHTGKGEASKIKHSLEPKPAAKHVCNLWINPETSEYEVDRCTHPINEVIPVYTALAQPEQEEPLPLVDIGVDVTPEGTHVVACYNRPDAVQEMFYSQFHPLTKPEQEAVCDKDPFYCWSIRCQVGKVCKHTAQPEREWVGLTAQEMNHVFAANVGYPERMCRAIETKLKEKNT